MFHWPCSRKWGDTTKLFFKLQPVSRWIGPAAAQYSWICFFFFLNVFSLIMRTFTLVTCAWLTPVATHILRYTVSKHGNKKLPHYVALELDVLKCLQPRYILWHKKTNPKYGHLKALCVAFLCHHTPLKLFKFSVCRKMWHLQWKLQFVTSETNNYANNWPGVWRHCK